MKINNHSQIKGIIEPSCPENWRYASCLSEARKLKMQLKKIKSYSERKVSEHKKQKFSELIDKAVQKKRDIDKATEARNSRCIGMAIPEQIIFSFNSKTPLISGRYGNWIASRKYSFSLKTILSLTALIISICFFIAKPNDRTIDQMRLSDNTDTYHEIRAWLNGLSVDNNFPLSDLKSITVEDVFASPFKDKYFVNCKNHTGDILTLEIERTDKDFQLKDIEI